MNELNRLLRSPEGEGGAGDGNPPPAPSPEPKGEVYTKEQMENYFNSNMAAARRKWEKEKSELEKNFYTKLGISGPEEVERLNSLREEAEKAELRKQEEKGQYQKILDDTKRKYEDQIKLMEAEKSGLHDKYVSYKKRVALQDAALKAGADPGNIDMIVNFTERVVNLIDDNTFQVIDHNNEPMLDPDNGGEISIENYMKRFLSDRPGLLKASGIPGAGSAGGGRPGHVKYTPAEIKHIAETDPAKYAELRKDGTVQAVVEAYAGKQN